MNKVTEINIIGEGLQLKRLIEENYTYNKLAKEFGLERDSLLKYLCKKQIDIELFKQQIENLFQKPYNQIITPVEDQIKDYIILIKNNIKDYDKPSDNKTMNDLYNLAMCYCQPYEQLTAKGNLALYKYNIGFHNEAVTVMEEVLDSCIKYDFKELIVYYTIQLSFIYLHIDKRKSRKVLQRAEEIIESQSIEDEFSKVTLFSYYYFYGIIFQSFEKQKYAREMFFKSLEYAIDDSKLARTLSNIGLTYYEEKKYRSALDWFNRALDKAQTHSDLKSGILNNIANLHLKKGEIGKAAQYIELAMKMISRESDYGRRLCIYDTYLDIHRNNSKKLLEDIIVLLDECVVFNENQHYLVSCLEKSLNHLKNNKDYVNIQKLIRNVLKYSRLEGEKRPLNDLKAIVVDCIHYLEDEGIFDINKWFEGLSNDVKV